MSVSTVVSDGSHRIHFIKLLQEARDISCPVERFCVRLVTRLDGSEIKAAEAINLRQVPNPFTTIFLNDTSFVDFMNGLNNYAAAFYQ